MAIRVAIFQDSKTPKPEAVTLLSDFEMFRLLVGWYTRKHKISRPTICHVVYNEKRFGDRSEVQVQVLWKSY